MTDQELLELAAKAAGIKTTRCLQYEDGAFDWPGKAGRWNPLTDDGDALRLAVKLGITIMFDHSSVWCEQYGVLEHYNGDPCAATRHAIVRAAAVGHLRGHLPPPA